MSALVCLMVAQKRGLYTDTASEGKGAPSGPGACIATGGAFISIVPSLAGCRWQGHCAQVRQRLGSQHKPSAAAAEGFNSVCSTTGSELGPPRSNVAMSDLMRTLKVAILEEQLRGYSRWIAGPLVVRRPATQLGLDVCGERGEREPERSAASKPAAAHRDDPHRTRLRAAGALLTDSDSMQSMVRQDRSERVRIARQDTRAASRLSPSSSCANGCKRATTRTTHLTCHYEARSDDDIWHNVVAVR